MSSRSETDAGLRWTDDQKAFRRYSQRIAYGRLGLSITGVVNQQWDQFTGRCTANWTPKLDFTDQTLVYGSYSHGYKAGGANPPGAALLTVLERRYRLIPIHPLTFKPEFIDAFELGSKNTLLDGALTINGDVFYYNYENYQISRNRRPHSDQSEFRRACERRRSRIDMGTVPGLRFNFAGGWEDTALAKGSQCHRSDGSHARPIPDWMVVKPFITQARIASCRNMSSRRLLNSTDVYHRRIRDLSTACGSCLQRLHLDPVTRFPM